MMGNSQLVEYGIIQEESDYRAHVCPTSGKIYIFPTARMLDLVLKKQYESRPVYTGSILTARGYLVPVTDIDDFTKTYTPSTGLWNMFGLDEKQSTSVKGQKAVDMVCALIRRGILQLPYVAEETDNFDLQVKGVDIYLNLKIHIQVKCDFNGGKSKNGRGTGNLFIQTHECNPHGQY